jgi:hypothetical protein
VKRSKWLGNDDLPMTPVLGPVNPGKREGGSAHGGPWYMRHPRFDYEKGNRSQEKTLSEKLNEARKRREARGAAAHPVRRWRPCLWDRAVGVTWGLCAGSVG